MEKKKIGDDLFKANSIVDSSVGYSFDASGTQEKDLLIGQLKIDLQNTKDDLSRLMNSAPEIKDLYKQLTESNEKIHTYESQILSMKTRIRQLQTKNNDLKNQIQLTDQKQSEEINQIKSQFSSQILKYQDQITKYQNESDNLFKNLEQLTSSGFSSFQDIFLFFKNQDHNPENNIAFKKLKEKYKKLKQSLENTQMKNRSDTLFEDIREERDRAQSDLENALRENEELKIFLSESKITIENLSNKNQKISQKFSSFEDMYNKLKRRNEKYKDALKEVGEKNDENNEPRINQLLHFLDEKSAEIDDLNKINSTLMAEKSEMGRQNMILMQKNREFISFKEMAQKENNNLKLSLQNTIDEKKLISSKLSKIEMENISLNSQLQSANQKAILINAKIQEIEADYRKREIDQNEFYGMIKIFENVIESQKQDLSQAIKIRNDLAEKLFKQNSLLAQEEILLAKQIEQNNHLKIRQTKLIENQKTMNNNISGNNFNNNCSADTNLNNVNYLLLGYLKELLLPELPNSFQVKFTSILDSSTFSIVQRLKQIFRSISDIIILYTKNNDNPIKEVNGYSLDHSNNNNNGNNNNENINFQNNSICLMANNQLNISPILTSNLRDIIERLKAENNFSLSCSIDDLISKIVNHSDVYDLFMKLVSINTNLKIDSSHLKEKMSRDMNEIAKIMGNIGCNDIVQIKNCFDKQNQKLKSTDNKLNEYKEIANILKIELQKKLGEIENLKSQNRQKMLHCDTANNNDNVINLLKQEITKMKLNEKKIIKKNEALKNESDKLRLKLQNTIIDAEKEKQNSLNSISDQEKKFEAHIAKLHHDLSASIQNSKQIESDFQKKLEMIEQKNRDSLAALNQKINEQDKAKEIILKEYSNRSNESEKSLKALVQKCKNENTKIEKLEREISQIRLEKKALEFQLKAHSNHGTCFATMLEGVSSKK